MSAVWLPVAVSSTLSWPSIWAFPMASATADAPKPPPSPPPPSPLTSSTPRANRHDKLQAKNFNFGCLNIRSLNNKVATMLDACRDHHIDVMFLVETWHDSDSVCLRTLRADGYHVVDHPRPRIRDDTLSVNHGGVAAVATPGIRLQQLDVGARPTTFELLCVRVTTNASSCIAAVIYRPGSEDVSPQFFVDLADTMDRLATFVEPTFIAGDINIWLNKPADSDTVRLVDILASHGFSNRVESVTHDKGGLIDIVATRDDLPPPSVDVLDVGLSDHRLLRWQAPLVRPSPVYTTVTSRPWGRLNPTVLQAELLSSPLCRPDAWSGLDVNNLARMYDSELTAILDRLIPMRTLTSRRRSSDPWFDDDCRVAKRTVRLFERDARRVRRAIPRGAAAANTDVGKAAVAAAAATARWYQRRREYHEMLREKRETFWKSKIDSEQSARWRSKLLERLVAKQLLSYLTTTKLLPDLLSAYRAFH